MVARIEKEDNYTKISVSPRAGPSKAMSTWWQLESAKSCQRLGAVIQATDVWIC